MYPVVILMLAGDHRDVAMIDAFLSLAPRLGPQRIVAMHVWRHEPLPGPLAQLLPEQVSAVPEMVHQRVDALRAALPDVQVELELASGSPVVALDRAQDELAPDLIVTGRRAAADQHAAWGPTGQNLVRHARCSSLIVPDAGQPPVNGAVVGLDFSSDAIDALSVAKRLFDDVACVLQYDPRTAPGSIPEREFREQLRRNAQEHFERDVLPRVPAAADIELELIAHNKASDALLERAGTDRAMVMGSRGMSPLAAMLLGSTAERVAGFANVPVFIVRTKGEVSGVVASLARR